MELPWCQAVPASHSLTAGEWLSGPWRELPAWTGTCCSWSFVHSAVFYPVGTLDTDMGTVCDSGLIPPLYLGNSAPCSALVHSGQASQLQRSPEAFANGSITRSANCRAEHDLLGRRADVHTLCAERSLAVRPSEAAAPSAVSHPQQGVRAEARLSGPMYLGAQGQLHTQSPGPGPSICS